MRIFLDSIAGFFHLKCDCYTAGQFAQPSDERMKRFQADILKDHEGVQMVEFINEIEAHLQLAIAPNLDLS